MKSQVAAQAAKEMNPEMHLQAWVTRVAPETENVYNHVFWDELTGTELGFFLSANFLTSVRRLQRAGQRKGAPVRRRSLRGIPQATAGERHIGPEGKHAGDCA